jgi:hypothetical protein
MMNPERENGSLSWEAKAAIIVAIITALGVIGAEVGPKLIDYLFADRDKQEAAENPLLIDSMDSTSEWNTYSDDKGSTIEIVPRQGMNDSALEIVYNLQSDGWVGVSKVIDADLLSGTKKIGFYYQGSGAPNTIELKLLYTPVDGENAVFSVLWHSATVKEDWTFLEAPYSDFICWVGTPCPEDGLLNVARVWKIDFAVSNKSGMGDEPGFGVVAIDDVQGVR